MKGLCSLGSRLILNISLEVRMDNCIHVVMEIINKRGQTLYMDRVDPT